MPDDATLAEHLGRSAATTASSSLEPFRKEVTEWCQQGVQGTTIHGVLRRRYGFEGSYSSVRRFLCGLGGRGRSATVILDFAPGESAQVDFGAGPKLPAADGGTVSTWFFVMTLAWSRHQYAEVVLDQKVETWLGCHQRAFEHFGGVPTKCRIEYVAWHIFNPELLWRATL